MTKEIERTALMGEIEESIKAFKVTVLLGPRACGKTGLVRGLGIPLENCFDLEDPMALGGFEDPGEMIRDLDGVVVLDAFQSELEMLQLVGELLERWGGPSRFLIIARPAPDSLGKLAEVFGGHLNVIRVGGLDFRDVGSEDRDRLWLRGGFPESFLSASEELSLRWRRSLIQMLLRRDLPDFGLTAPGDRLRQLLRLVAESHGETWNSSAIATSLGVSPPTARAYLEVLSEACVVRKLRPFVTRAKKREVKAPKVYLRDSGLLHSLLEIESVDALRADLVHGASWEGFAMEQVVSVLCLKPEEMFFWATHGGAELDLVVERDGKRYGFEFAVSDKLRVTHSMTIAKADLELDRVFLVHPGESSFQLREGIEALGFAGLACLKLP